MIALLTGRLAHKSPESIILDVNGVGYRVQVPFSTYFDLPAEGASVTLHIHTHVKEDAIHLFGFRTLGEKELFQLMISVSGVGPRLATNILSNIGADDFSQALLRGDLARLSNIPGIGKKTAERLVLELREKIRKLTPDASAEVRVMPGGKPELRDDVLSALINLGYKEATVARVLDAMQPAEGDTVEDILRSVLKKLMK